MTNAMSGISFKIYRPFRALTPPLCCDIWLRQVIGLHPMLTYLTLSGQKGVEKP